MKPYFERLLTGKTEEKWSWCNIKPWEAPANLEFYTQHTWQKYCSRMRKTKIVLDNWEYSHSSERTIDVLITGKDEFEPKMKKWDVRGEAQQIP